MPKRKNTMNKQRQEELECEIRGYVSEYLYPLAKELRIRMPKIDFGQWEKNCEFRKETTSDLRPRTNIDGKVISMVGDWKLNVHFHIIMESLQKDYEWVTITKGMVQLRALFFLTYEFYKLHVYSHEFERFINRSVEEVQYDQKLEEEAIKFAIEFMDKKVDTTFARYMAAYLANDFKAKYFVYSSDVLSKFKAQREIATDSINKVLKYLYGSGEEAI